MPRNKAEDAPPPESWKPTPWELPDASAIQALSRGDADPEQQRRALRFIVDKLCRTYDLSFRPSGDRETVFAEGSRFVGLQLVKLIKINLAHFRKKTAGEASAPGEQG